MPIKQTIPTNSGDYLQFGNATTPVAAQVGGYEDSTGNGHLELYTTASGTVTERMRIDKDGNVGIGTSSPAAKLDVNGNINSVGSYTLGNYTVNRAFATAITSAGSLAVQFDGTTQGYISSPATSALAFYTSAAGTERMRIDSSGNVQIATTSQSNGAVLTVAGTVSASLNGRIYSLGTYNNTTASGANMHIATDGHMFRSTSSIKYKTNIQDAIHGLDKVMELRPVTYKGINDGDTVFGGLIAEEVHDAGLTEFVQYAEDGSPDALAYGQMVALAFKAIQEQQTIINDLKARIETLEAK